MATKPQPAKTTTRPVPQPPRREDKATRQVAAPAAKPAPAPAPEPEETEQEQPGTGLTTTTTAATAGSAPAELLDFLDRDVGQELGLSKDKEDNLIPLVYLLQPLSPQAQERNPAFMPGAKPGMIWLRNYPEPLVDGDDGIWAQPCHWSKCVIEWVPRNAGGGGGKGFVARHATMPVDAVATPDAQNPKKMRMMSPRGTEYVETREHVVMLHIGEQRVPYVIPMAGSNHSTSKGWMFQMNTRTHKGRSVNSFAMVYRLSAKFMSGDLGDWFKWEVNESRWVSPEDYVAGKNLAEAASSGDKQAESPVSDIDGDGQAGYVDGSTIDHEDVEGAP